MALDAFLDRLQGHSGLEPADVNALRALEYSLATLAPGELLVREGSKISRCSVLVEGVAIAFKVVGDGAKQTTDLFFPGQIVDADGLVLSTLDYSVRTVSRSQFAFLDCQSLLKLAFERPEIGKALWRESHFRASVAREWIANVSRRDARSGIAHVICEIAARLSLLKEGQNVHFEFPLNQDQLSQVVGLTPMHVSRTLTRLEEEGVLSRKGKALAIQDWERLKAIGDFDPGYLHEMT